MLRWRGFSVAAAPPVVAGEDLLGKARPPNTVLGRRDPTSRSSSLRNREPVSQSRVVGVDVQGGGDQLCVVPVPLRNRVLETPASVKQLASRTAGRTSCSEPRHLVRPAWAREDYEITARAGS